MSFPGAFAPLFERDAALERYSALRLGGPADWLYVESESNARLAEVVQAAWQSGTPVTILGGGANCLISDSGIRGLVVINRVANVSFDESTVLADAGHGLTVLAHRCATRGLAGLEWAASVPGTVGGAVVNNAGAHDGDMADSVVEVSVIDAEHGALTLSGDQLAYGYRTSSLKARPDRRFLVLDARLALNADDPASIRARMADYVTYRRRTQPPGASLGSIFRNPPGDYAGRLIEACGLKGLTIGGAQVSTIHANFFINTGGAKAADYRALIERVRQQVASVTGVDLIPEVEFIGQWDPR